MGATCFGLYLGQPQACQYKILTQEDTIRIQVSFSINKFGHGEAFGILIIAYLRIMFAKYMLELHFRIFPFSSFTERWDNIDW